MKPPDKVRHKTRARWRKVVVIWVPGDEGKKIRSPLDEGTVALGGPIGISRTMADEHGSAAAAPPVDFIRTIVDEDLATGRHNGRVATRFPPEPNGYLHIGHAKSICLNFGIADERGGICNLRFDDTNPTKEDVEYVDSIQRGRRLARISLERASCYASDYFERLYRVRRAR